MGQGHTRLMRVLVGRGVTKRVNGFDSHTYKLLAKAIFGQLCTLLLKGKEKS